MGADGKPGNLFKHPERPTADTRPPRPTARDIPEVHGRPEEPSWTLLNTQPATAHTPHTRELYARWDEEAARAVASLRLVAGRYRDDRALADLVGELTLKSDDFAGLWARHPVHTCQSGRKWFRHPEVGDLDLEFEVLHLPDDTGHRIQTYTALPGTASDAALRVLAHQTASVLLR
ncbi:hypothetical protein ABGB12_13915 [Actinocorallia sp. B10E7]|uniref:MmyB family transcriptional regulator n=1 Tax=Actinocorallia sp. B10E7 TaxID=3153558 RepID=UPI00325C456E